MSDSSGYIHGYTDAEAERLIDQAEFLARWVFDGVDFATHAAQQCRDQNAGSIRILGEQHARPRTIETTQHSGIGLRPGSR